MEFRASLKDRLRRTRSAIFSFGSQKPITLAPSKSNRFYNFGDAIGHNRPTTPVIERQYIPLDLEKEIRYSCYRLQRNIERGIPSCEIQPKPETVKDQPATARGTSNKAQPQPSSLPATLKSQKDRHDSGVELEDQQGAADRIGVSQQVGLNRPRRPYSYSAYYASSSVPSSQGAGQSDMPYSSGETLVGNEIRISHDRQTSISTAQQSSIRGPTNTENDRYSGGFLHSDANSMSCIASSLSRPPVASRLVRKKRFENLHGASVQGSQSGTGVSSSQEPSARSRYSWLPRTEARPASAMELGASYRRHTAREVVIIDNNGGRHALTASEEIERHRDLQQAVREKMYSGQIRPKPASTSMNNKRASSPLPCLDSFHEEKVSSGQSSKRKLILRKLSFLGFGKQKAETKTLRNKDTVGFNRIMEAV